jgi:peptide/nickel transport system ATP-binding protein
MKRTPLLHIDQLSVQFRTMDGISPAIKQVNIKIHEGETVAIVGESGSGKSVTSMSILQLHPPALTDYTEGKIVFYREHSAKPINLLQCNKTQLQQIRGKEIAMIFQEPMTSLNPVMRCGEQLLEALVVHKKINTVVAKQQVLYWFEKVQLPTPEITYNKYPHELSGGQKQRVMIAMAMCCQPRLLICDEPTTALDVTVQKNILLLIKALQKEFNMSVIFISHDLHLVQQLADTIVVMQKGKVVEQGPAAQLLSHPTHVYTKALLACRPALYPKGTRLPLVNDFLQNENYSPVLKLPTTTPPNATQNNILFDIQNITIQYPTKRSIWGKAIAHYTALQNLSLQIFEGETLGLVGESGCGKTTLGRTLLQLIQPSSGTILYNKQPLQDIPKQQTCRQIQMVFQDPYSSLNPRMTIGAAIAEPMLHIGSYSKKNVKDAVVHLLQKVELLPEHYSRYPHEFSGGQRQRIVIARALAMQPKFIVCDESVSALDVSVQAQVLNLLNDLKSEFGFTNLFISHDLNVVRYISDRIAVMQAGQIVELGNADAVFYQPKNAYTQLLLNSI